VILTCIYITTNSSEKQKNVADGLRIRIRDCYLPCGRLKLVQHWWHHQQAAPF